MKKALFILFIISGVSFAGYYAYTHFSKPNAQNRTGVIKTYVPDTEHPLSFCGELVPVDSAYVKKRIEKEIAILTTYRSSTMKLFNRTTRWFPQIAQVLIDNNVPEDFKYLAMIESNLTNVVSPKGATGFWQFMRTTGRNMGLEINQEVDERFDPIKATEAASRYFKLAKEDVKTWTNAAASYNMGISGLMKQIKRQKNDSYYHLRLNRETARYLYKAIAFKEVFEHRTKYGFSEELEIEKEEEVEVYEIEENIHSLIELAESEGITYTALRKFNPWLRGNTLTHKSSSKKYYLKIPVDKMPYAVKTPTQTQGLDWYEE